MEDGAARVISLLLLILLLVNIFFVLAQIKLVNTMQVHNQIKLTKKVWLWTQLIPLWGYLAFMVALIKMEDQFQEYLSENALESNQNIKHFSTTWGWIYITSLLLSQSHSLMGIIAPLAPIGFIVFWIHINRVKQSLLMPQD